MHFDQFLADWYKHHGVSMTPPTPKEAWTAALDEAIKLVETPAVADFCQRQLYPTK